MKKYKVSFHLMAPSEEDAVKMVEQLVQKATESDSGAYDDFNAQLDDEHGFVFGQGRLSGAGSWPGDLSPERDDDRDGSQ